MVDKNWIENLYKLANLQMCLLFATVAIFENVPQGKMNVFIPAKWLIHLEHKQTFGKRKSV